ncbi:MAG: phage tail sheath subtilisin-like domain-containing protein [Candidatus Bathyarchaeia archaeon]
MATFLSPRVQVTEVDISEFVSNIPTSVGVIVVRARRGGFEPVFLTSTRQLRQMFCFDRARLDADLIELRSAYDFLSVGYSGLWVVRAIADDAKGSCIVINSNDSEVPVSEVSFGLSISADKTGYVFPEWGNFSEMPFMLLYAKSPGRVGNQLKVKVSDVNQSEKTFRFIVRESLPDGSENVLFDRVVSWVPGKFDGFGNSMYILDVLERDPDIGVRLNQGAIEAGKVIASLDDFVSLTGGSDGFVDVGDVLDALKQFENTERWDIDLLIQGGIGGDILRTVLVDMAVKRGDCFAVLDVDRDVFKVEEISLWRRANFAVSSSYGAVFVPWLKVYDSDNDRELFVPPSGLVAGMLARCDYEYDPWWVPAGLSRGVVNVLGLRYYYSLGERDELDRVQVNAFIRKPGVIALWNNRTLQTFESAFSFIEVRRLFNYIKKNVCRVIDRFLFEPLTDGTRLRIIAMLDEFFRTIKQRLGIYDYKIVSDPLGSGNNPPAQVDQGMLTVEVYVKPVRAIRYIWLKVIATRFGYRFEERG